MRNRLALSVIFMSLAWPLDTIACEPWQALPFDAFEVLSPCVEPAVERRVGKVCLRHEWLCGHSRFKDWFDQWMSEIDEPVYMERRAGQLIFSGQRNRMAWALFWMPVQEDASEFVVLVSRMRDLPLKD